MYNIKPINYLDKLRLYKGNNVLKAKFREITERSREEAENLISDPNMFFCSLFVLLEEVDSLNLYHNLSPRNVIALKTCAKALKNKTLKDKTEYLISDKTEIEKDSLEWIVNTGYLDDGLSDDYDEVLDTTASILINEYKDNTILPVLAYLIFKRNRKGRYIHDLVWVFFRAYDADSIKLIARYISSADKRDVELAKNLLNISDDSIIGGKKKYKSYIKWIQENYPYICFTNESMLQSSNPSAYEVNLEAKYLCKGIPAKKQNIDYSEDEQKCLECFNNLSGNEKTILSRYSNKIHGQNLNRWNEWISYPINEQLKIAGKGLGGRR